LKGLAQYSGLSVRRLRDYLRDRVHPLRHYRVGGKILVKRSEFDEWVSGFRAKEPTRLDAIVAGVLKDL
jgi:excisionase family DNA binding protein